MKRSKKAKNFFYNWSMSVLIVYCVLYKITIFIRKRKTRGLVVTANINNLSGRILNKVVHFIDGVTRLG